MRTKALFITMVAAYITLFLAATNLGTKTTPNPVVNDSISTTIYESRTMDDAGSYLADENLGKKVDDQVASESISNRYLGCEETGFYVNDGSLD